MIKVTADFETLSEAPFGKVKNSVGAYEYSLHPSTKVACFGFKASNSKTCYLFKFETMQKRFNQLPVAFQNLWIGWVLDGQVVFSAHNAFFEQCIYNNILVKRFGWPSIPIFKWRCTAAKAAAHAIPRALDNACAVMQTRRQKDFEGHRVMLKLCKPTKAYKAWLTARNEVAEGKRVGPKKLALLDKPAPAKFWTPETAPADYAALYHYCKLDVLSEEDLDNSLPDLNPAEQKLWFLDQRINMRGVAVDMPLVNRISQIMADEAKTMTKELDILTMGLVSSGNARAAILDFLTLEGLDLPNLRAKTVDDFLENGKATGDAKIVLEIRRALSKASTAKYKKFQILAASDGRVRDLLLFCAASTGRWGGKNIQPQNFPRGIIKDIYEAIDRIKKCTVDELKLLYGENLMPLFSSVLRGMFIATPGHDLFVEDYSAIECRVTWFLAGHEQGLQMFRDGVDPYRVMAAIIFKKSILLVTDEERQVGKAAVLGCGYQMGGNKFVTSAWDVYRAKVTLEIARVSVTEYRKAHYPVVEMWDQYQEACILATENPKSRYRVGKVKFYREGKFLKIELPSGRKLSYFDPKILVEKVFPYIEKNETKYTSDLTILRTALSNGAVKKTPFDSKKFTYMAHNLKAKKTDCVIPKWTREKSYGGKIVENVVQAVSRDILAEAITRSTKAGFNVLMHSHDELVSEAPKGKFKLGRDSKGNLFSPEYRKVLEDLPAWAAGLPLTSGGWAGERYRKG